MNQIIHFLTNDLMVGWDKYNQLNVMTRTEDGGFETRYLADPRGLICPICNCGWIMSGPGIRDQAQQKVMGKLVHESCLLRMMTIREYETFQGLLAGITMAHSEIEAIPNEYGGGYNTSWHKAAILRPNAKKDWDTGRFSIRMGRRKRVWSMHLSISPPLDDLQLARVKAGTLGLWEHTKHLSHAEIYIHTYSHEECAIVMDAFESIIEGIDVPMPVDA